MKILFIFLFFAPIAVMSQHRHHSKTNTAIYFKHATSGGKKHKVNKVSMGFTAARVDVSFEGRARSSFKHGRRHWRRRHGEKWRIPSRVQLSMNLSVNNARYIRL